MKLQSMSLLINRFRVQVPPAHQEKNLWVSRRLRGMATARLGLTALDCSDPSVLADFWAALLGGEVTHRNDEFHAVRVDGDWVVAVKGQDYKPPTWPDPTVP